jgi:hypothetical protein
MGGAAELVRADRLVAEFFAFYGGIADFLAGTSGLADSHTACTLRLRSQDRSFRHARRRLRHPLAPSGR